MGRSRTSGRCRNRCRRGGCCRNCRRGRRPLQELSPERRPDGRVGDWGFGSPFHARPKMQAHDIHGTVFQNGAATLLARVVGNGGARSSTPTRRRSPTRSASWTTTTPDFRRPVEGHQDVALDPAAVDLRTSSRTDALWTVDAVGYNFRHQPDVSASQPSPGREKSIWSSIACIRPPDKSSSCGSGCTQFRTWWFRRGQSHFRRTKIATVPSPLPAVGRLTGSDPCPATRNKSPSSSGKRWP